MRRAVAPNCDVVVAVPVVKLGVVAIASPQFDLAFAEQNAESAFHNLRTAFEVFGSPALAMDASAVSDTIEIIDRHDVDAIVVLHATFTDSSLAVAATDHGKTTVLWAFPEERTGGPLRLNSLSGANLAAFVLCGLERDYGWVLAHASDPSAPGRVSSALASSRSRNPVAPPTPSGAFSGDLIREAADLRDRLATMTVGRIGKPPSGIQASKYDEDELQSVVGVSVDKVQLPSLFERSDEADESRVEEAGALVEGALSGLDDLDDVALEKSLRLHAGLAALAEEFRWSGAAVRCWPETFSDYGGAACTPMGMLTDAGIATACESDVYGAVSCLILSSLADAPAMSADLVDLDADSNTGVLWRCGVAPFGMAEPEGKREAIDAPFHRKPLLSEFAIRSGRVTIARLSRSRSSHRLVIGGGEILGEPTSFSGTSGVIRFDRSTRDVFRTVMSEGLEHRYGVVHGDVRDPLRAFASVLELPVVDL